jgi:serine/threonine protein phosphatase PrpC
MNAIINETLELQGVMLMKIFGREREKEVSISISNKHQKPKDFFFLISN